MHNKSIFQHMGPVCGPLISFYFKAIILLSNNFNKGNWEKTDIFQ